MTGLLSTAWRRHVPHALGVYLAACWGFLEFLAWLGNRVAVPSSAPIYAAVVLFTLVPTIAVLAYFRGAPEETAFTRAEKVTASTNLIVTLAIVLILGKSVGFSGHGAAGPVERRQFTFRGDVMAASPSPEGRRVAYVVRDSGGASLLVADVEGNQTETLARSEVIRDIRWLPDGTGVSFYAAAADTLGLGMGVQMVDLTTGGRRFLNGGAYHDWSPDGTRVATAWQNSRNISVFEVDQGRTTSIPVGGDFRWIADVSWSPREDVLGVLLSTDSAAVIQTIPLSGGPQSRIAVVDSAGIDSFHWSTDGRWLIYRIGETVWRAGVNPMDGTPRGSPQEVPSLHGTERFTLSRDGRTAALVEIAGGSNLWLLTLDDAGTAWARTATALTQGTSEKNYASISPAGRFVAYIDEGRESDLLVVDLDTRNTRRLTGQGLAQPRSLTWSPDGALLAFATGENTATLHVMRADGSEHRTLDPDPPPSANGVLVFCGGSTLVYQTAGVRNMALLGLDSNEGELILSANAPGYPFPRRCSVDGSRLAFWWNQTVGTGLWVIGFHDGDQLRLGGTAASSLHWSSVDWSRDGTEIFAWDAADAVLLAFSLPGGERRLFPNPTFDPDRVDVVTVAADGRTVIVD
ncbi:MAG: hypothetical protein ABIF09_09100, partial [Gemmatimonadota bacterium]